MQGASEHVSFTIDDSQIAWVTLDKKNASANSLNEAVLLEFEQVIQQLNQQPQLAAVVIRSAKSTFVVGADIESFVSIKDATEATQLIKKGQAIFNQLEAMKVPTIALIEGMCLGGGMELALACDYRIADDGTKTRLGLPEVKLGIHPGWGGTVRLPALVGIFNSMDLILSGRTLTAKAAKRMGLVDRALPKRLLEAAVRDFVKNKPETVRLKWYHNVPTISVLRPLVGKLFYQQLNKKVSREHYPAPFHVVDNWIANGTLRPAAMDLEASSIGELLVSSTSRSLVDVFFMQERLKGLAKKQSDKPSHVHVVGAGTMGGDIAAWCALRGMTVTVQDTALPMIGQTIKRAHKLFKKKLKAQHLVTGALDRLIPDPKGLGIPQADVIIEAISENLEAKQGLFKFLEGKAKPSAVLATNTSTIPLEEIASTLQSPSRLVGIHFFNPVPQMPLVEVVHGQGTDAAMVAKATAFVGAIDKLPLPVKSAPGFLVNRILLPYMLEAVTMLEEGVQPEVVDMAALQFGMPMGPVELADTVGLDICLAALERMSELFNAKVPAKLRQLVADGHLGKKSGKGFYQYDKKGKAKKSKEYSKSHVPSDLADRLSLRLVNEAMACLREGIVEDQQLLNAGSIFGFGFPPFEGGVLNYAKRKGTPEITKRLEELTKRYGDRFEADKGWESEQVA